jgi:hypothetical protein
MLVMAQTPVLAYVDPGSGTLLVQVIAAFFVGSLFYVKRAVNWLRGKRKPEVKPGSPEKKAQGR